MSRDQDATNLFERERTQRAMAAAATDSVERDLHLKMADTFRLRAPAAQEAA